MLSLWKANRNSEISQSLRAIYPDPRPRPNPPRARARRSIHHRTGRAPACGPSRISGKNLTPPQSASLPPPPPVVIHTAASRTAPATGRDTARREGLGRPGGSGGREPVTSPRRRGREKVVACVFVRAIRGPLSAGGGNTPRARLQGQNGRVVRDGLGSSPRAPR